MPSAMQTTLLETKIESASEVSRKRTSSGRAGVDTSIVRTSGRPSATKARPPETAMSQVKPGVSRELIATGAAGLKTSTIRSPDPLATNAWLPETTTFLSPGICMKPTLLGSEGLEASIISQPESVATYTRSLEANTPNWVSRFDLAYHHRVRGVRDIQYTQARL